MKKTKKTKKSKKATLKCPYCDNKYVKQNNLEKHIMEKHSGNIEPTIPTASPVTTLPAVLDNIISETIKPDTQAQINPEEKKGYIIKTPTKPPIDNKEIKELLQNPIVDDHIISEEEIIELKLIVLFEKHNPKKFNINEKDISIIKEGYNFYFNKKLNTKCKNEIIHGYRALYYRLKKQKKIK